MVPFNGRILCALLERPAVLKVIYLQSDFLVSLISPKNENKSTLGIIVVKSNFFVPFLGELRIPKSPSEIN